MSEKPKGEWAEVKLTFRCGRCREDVYPGERAFFTFARNRDNLCEGCATRMLAGADAWRSDPTTKWQGEKIRKLSPGTEVPTTKGEASDLIERLLADQ